MANCSLVAKIPPPVAHDQLVFFIIISVSSLSMLALWVAEKRKYDHTRIRPTALVVISAMGPIFTGCSIQLYDYVGHMLPCWVMSFLLPNIIPFVMGPITSRLVIFYFHAKFSNQLADLVPTTVVDLAKDEEDEEDGNESLHLSKSSHGGRCAVACARFWDVINLAVLEFLCQRSSKDRVRYMYASKFMLSAVGIWTVCTVIGLPFAIASVAFAIANIDYMIVCQGCAQNADLLTLFAVIGAFSLSWNVFIRYRAHSLAEDPWGFRNEATRCQIYVVCAVTCFAVSYEIRDTYPIVNYLTTTFTLLPVVDNTVWQLVVARRQHKQLRSSSNTTQTTTSSTRPMTSRPSSPSNVAVVVLHPGDLATLDQILSVPKLETAFEVHLQREYGMESLLFLRDVKQWKQAYFDMTPQLRRVRAKRLCGMYIDTSGLLQVNIPDGMAQAIKRAMGNKVVIGEEGEDLLHVFDDAVTEIKHLLSVGAVKRFHLTSDYTRALQMRRDTSGLNLAAVSAMVKSVVM